MVTSHENSESKRKATKKNNGSGWLFSQPLSFLLINHEWLT